MPSLTLINRTRDNLPLVESIEEDSKDHHQQDTLKRQAKALLQNFRGSPDTNQSFESGASVFHIMVSNGVTYLTLTEKSFPKKLAYAFLTDVRKEFEHQFAHELDRHARPYPFIKFDRVLKAKKADYASSRSQRNLSKLNDDLTDIHGIITRNISDVLERGQKLNDAAVMSSSLLADSKTFLANSKRLDLLTMWRSYAPYVVVLLVIIIIVIVRFVW